MAKPPNARPPREAHKLDETTLATFLATHPEGFPDADVSVAQFKGGQSNPTYWVGVRHTPTATSPTGETQLVLRKKPPGKLLPSAHAVEREFRVMRALQHTDVPVPQAVLLCEDERIVGTPFFLMRWEPGTIHWDPTLPEVDATTRAAIYRTYVDALARLHRVDFDAVGLGDFGKVGHYIQRQVERWSTQYEASRTSHVAPMERLMEWLRANVPADDRTSLIHGDYRLDNMIFDAERPAELRAIVDWELSTLGHPLTDLAYACMSYHVTIPGRGGLAGVDVQGLGIPREDELVDRYCASTGQSAIADWPYFMAFGMFRLAAIAQGVYKRGLVGNASSDDATGFGSAVQALAELACGVAQIPTR